MDSNILKKMFPDIFESSWDKLYFKDRNIDKNPLVIAYANKAINSYVVKRMNGSKTIMYFSTERDSDYRLISSTLYLDENTVLMNKVSSKTLVKLFNLDIHIAYYIGNEQHIFNIKFLDRIPIMRKHTISQILK